MIICIGRIEDSYSFSQLLDVSYCGKYLLYINQDEMITIVCTGRIEDSYWVYQLIDVSYC